MGLKIFLAFLIFPILANAGAISGGGGKGVICSGNNNGAVASVKLLDLWEAQTLFGQNPVILTGNLAADVDDALVRLKNSYPFPYGTGSIGNSGTTYTGQDYVLAILRLYAEKFLKPNPDLLRLHGVTLSQTDDSYESAQPNNCSIQQLVNYQPNDKIWINEDLVGQMDELNQAALIVHESLYALLREFSGENNSVRARRAVGYVFGGNEIPFIQPALPPNIIECHSNEMPYPKNDITVFFGQDSDGTTHLKYYPTLLSASEPMGVSKPLLDLGPTTDYEAGLTTSGCPHNMDFSITSKGMLNGPVEFDRDVQFNFGCQGGQMQAYLTTSNPGMSGSQTSSLTCQLETPKK